MELYVLYLCRLDAIFFSACWFTSWGSSGSILSSTSRSHERNFSIKES
jgi:hypothetical protein